ncbi:acyltransferase [Bradyrhizobium sp. UFLA03-84]|uniref:acyltransferase family protein n=1 Tax=Bradyrhizobium sp. UFLA03-84 TaxID=418599 RepID=UPI000BAE4E98|nr:acyltransferase [Bradyrhizobium sp. UFLA03-84]PAY05383.1 acyltransferase [Bradyrhizobium sp. UFLA03-84]
MKSPTFDQGTPSELRALTGLRGLAATTVALAHFRLPLPYDAGRFLMWHNAAVDLFFCLSGFTLFYVYRRDDTFEFRTYLLARIARIYPLYVVSLLVAGALIIWPLIINPVTYPISAALHDFWRQLLMLNAWPLVGSGVHWDFPAWSISVEWFCYVALFPILLALPAPRSTFARLVMVMSLSLISYRLFLAYFDERITSAELYVAENQWSYWVSVLRGICGFTVGWLIFASYQKRDLIYVLCTRHSLIIWLAFIAVMVLRYLGLIHSQALVFLFPFVVLAATDSSTTASHLLGSKILHFLGVISYSIYLTHFLILALFIRIFPTFPAWAPEVYAVLVGTTLIVSSCCYFIIERPARGAIRRIGARKEILQYVASD